MTALTKVQSEVIEVYEDLNSDIPTQRWQERVVVGRSTEHGYTTIFTQAELLALLRKIEAFWEVELQARHGRMLLFAMPSTHPHQQSAHLQSATQLAQQ